MPKARASEAAFASATTPVTGAAEMNSPADCAVGGALALLGPCDDIIRKLLDTGDEAKRDAGPATTREKEAMRAVATPTAAERQPDTPAARATSAVVPATASE
eukprot:6636751-Lingulodinium_polyedra.AAC.1